ncbi:hypothetical protein PF010_g13264 [Phytophthora fragariae]|nr:hypothetical protein PF003_g19325 [Phytophthora fragariae]KAE8935143.1 hypothetical protein PF009_g14902 [Phytophthora fragariae]KAE9104750.1 hypothetical protein PF010_g13264 [Phytophthora fragariae]KAE9104767.1 hypothetical protein PF007_g13938 [Phytophthora fragariae]KAE9142186.1 hypothetical protein PF006_g12679 [Phytophthora fragariae]
MYWDEDGAEGRPSSMDVLLQFLSVPGNAERWLKAAAVRDGTRVALIDDIYESLVDQGITHHTRGNIDVKLWSLLHSFQKVEHWLRKKELRRFDDNDKAKRKVLKACPYYPELVRLLRPTGCASTSKSKAHRRDTMSTNDSVRSDNEPPEVASKRVHTRGKSDTTKRTKLDHHSDQVGAGNAQQTSLWEAEEDVRRELYKVELQAKRDEAICVRMKACKELLELGVSVAEVDRLMPLWKSNAYI